MKHHFPIFETNPDLVFLDSANSTHKPRPVIESIDRFYRDGYANIHRGMYPLSENAEESYNAAKRKVARWIGADESSEIVCTYSATYAANIVAQTFASNGVLKRGDVVILSLSEHHANIVPWQMLQEKIGIKIRYVGLDDEHRIDLDELSDMMSKKVKVVSLQHISNVTGAIHPLEHVRKIIGPDRYFVIDMAQSVPHGQVDVGVLDCDFAFFSGHKTLADTGVGVLYGKKELLKKFDAPISGGGAINTVLQDSYEQAGLPYKWEPGSQHVGGMISLGVAIDFLQDHPEIHHVEAGNTEFALEQFLARDDEVILHGPKHDDRIGVFSFSIEGVHINDISEILAGENICIRSGHHCCEPLHRSWGLVGSARMSLYLYNDQTDILRFFEAIDTIIAGKSA